MLCDSETWTGLVQWNLQRGKAGVPLDRSALQCTSSLKSLQQACAAHAAGQPAQLTPLPFRNQTCLLVLLATFITPVERHWHLSTTPLHDVSWRYTSCSIMQDQLYIYTHIHIHIHQYLKAVLDTHPFRAMTCTSYFFAKALVDMLGSPKHTHTWPWKPTDAVSCKNLINDSRGVWGVDNASNCWNLDVLSLWSEVVQDHARCALFVARASLRSLASSLFSVSISLLTDMQLSNVPTIRPRNDVPFHRNQLRSENYR